ncbi:MAG TPA: hypothetical protein VFG19_00565 [Geobacteraceae bacterium]|nr:hypothetical protein [Geobacteraceae bacterium]
MENQPDNTAPARGDEWFVPKFGPQKFRIFLGLLFLPYTGMVLSFALIGSLLAGHIFYDRILAIIAIYFFGLGIAAHALDALGGGGTKPWGTVFSESHLWLMALTALLIAYGIAVYYMIRHVPLLLLIAVPEGFFVFAYNLEWFGGRFHTDRWFAFSWGTLPVLAGYVMQTNGISVPSILVAISMGFFSTIEIKASRPYKELRRKRHDLSGDELALMRRYETILKCVSLGVIVMGAGLLIWRAALSRY